MRSSRATTTSTRRRSASTRRCTRRGPDIIGAAHTHSTYGRALSSLGELLEPITQDVCAFYNDHSLFDDYTGVVTDIEEGKRIAHALGDNKAVILRNHGLLTGGTSRSTRPSGGSSRWSAPARCSSSRRPRATVVHIDATRPQKTHDYRRLGARRLVLVPAVVGEDHPRTAGPARLNVVSTVVEPLTTSGWRTTAT